MRDGDTGEGVKDGLRSLVGKYLTFCLQREEYGIEILKVREIIGLMDITPIPQTLPYMKGVINLRGKIIPVIDLRLKFGMPEAPYARETCIIVVDAQGVPMGIIVNMVSEVLDIRIEDLEETPSFGASIRTDFIRGMAKGGNRVRILLDIDRVLSTEEMAMIEASSASSVGFGGAGPHPTSSSETLSRG